MAGEARAITSRAHLRPIETAVLAVVGLGCGLSPFLYGFYDSALWVPIGLVVMVLAVAAQYARPHRLTALGLVAIGAVAGLGLLCILSSSWSGSAENAVVDGNRLLVYAALLSLLTSLLRSRTHIVVALAAFVAGALVVAGVDLAGMLAGDGTAFMGGRLNGPLGYINGQGNFFLLAAWPCVGLARQRDRPTLAAAGLGSATLFACLALLSESRGVILAGVVSAVLVLVLVPGRLHRAAALLVLAVGVAIALPSLLDVYRGAAPAAPDGTALHRAAAAALASALGVAVIWRIALLTESRGRRRGTGVVRAGRAAVVVGLGTMAVAGCLYTANNAGGITGRLATQYDAFVQLDASVPQRQVAGRLLSGGGNRFDYWRVAVRAWTANPFVGSGAGSYPQWYFRLRRTTENIRQPHSIELEVLADLGLLGAALLLVAFGVVSAAAVCRRRLVQSSAGAESVLVSAVGVLASWGVQASVDWMHLLPGLTGAAVIGGAAVLARGPNAPRRPHPTGVTVTGAIVGAAVVVVAMTSLSRQLLADFYRARGQTQLATAPAQALHSANRSLRVDGDATATYYLKAAALARFGAADAAEATLNAAIAREPGNFLSYALLGDLLTRRGRRHDAHTAYATALRLNPRDPALRALVRTPLERSTRQG